MCRNITELRGLQPPATAEEIEAAAIQYVRKVSGVRQPLRTEAAAAAFDDAVRDIAAVTTRLLALMPERRQPPPSLPPLRRPEVRARIAAKSGLRPAMALTDAELSDRARALAGALEPFAGQVYFSPECHEGYAALGFSPSPFKTETGVQVPDGPAYFTSRGSVMGQVPGEVVAAAFGVFDPRIVVPAVTHGWTLTDAATIAAARTDGAVGQLARILGDEPDGIARAADLFERAGEGLAPAGRSLFAGMLSQPVPDTSLGRAWRMADRLREYRGDAHIAAWTAAGFDGCSISLMTERWWGLPMRSYSRTRGWTDDDFDAATERLRAAGHLDGDDLTESGRAAREELEAATDRQCRPIVESLGDDLDELVGTLLPWGADIRAAGGYLPGGPHELAGRRG